MSKEEIINLIIENKDLPIYAYVATEVVEDTDNICYWLGKATSARISEICFVEPFGSNDQSFFERSDYVDYVEYLCEKRNIDDFDEESIDNIIKEVLNLNYQKVILLCINTIGGNNE